MFNLCKDLFKHRELLLILVGRNIKIRYKSSVLGFFWTLLGPILLIVIYATFLHLIKFNIELPVLVTGIIAWQFLAMCMGDSLHAIMGNANLVTKAFFPRIILPGAMVLANAMNFLLSLVVLVIYLIIVGANFGNLVLLPFVILTQFALCLGMSLVISTLNVFFRDTEHLLSTIMLAWFFLTPVVYPEKLVTDTFGPTIQCLFFANPMTGILAAYRSAFLSSAVSWQLISLSGSVAWCICIIGLIVFQKAQARFGDEL